MNDLRAMLGDRSTDVLRAAITADNPDHERAAIQVGGTLGKLMFMQTALRVESVLVAVLPDLLEWAWEEGYQASVSVIASGSLAFNPYRAHRTPTTPPRSDADAQAAHGATPGTSGGQE